MKYGAFFCLLAAFSGWLALTSHPVFWWLCANSIFMAMVYTDNRPEWFKKSSNGRLPFHILLINGPWLLVTHMVWHIQRILSSEPPYHLIEGTNFIIGRRLLLNELPEHIDVVIDLTSEFNEPSFPDVKYYSIPLLDGVAPPKYIVSLLAIERENFKGKNVYIHCAQGHGRTATVASLLLVIDQVYSTPDEGYRKVLESRPKTKVSTSQLTFLNNAYELIRETKRDIASVVETHTNLVEEAFAAIREVSDHPFDAIVGVKKGKGLEHKEVLEAFYESPA